MHRIAVTSAKDDDADLLCHCNVFLSLFGVFVLPSFKEHISRNTFQWLLPNVAYNTLEFKLCSMFKQPQWDRHDLWPKWSIAPMEKALWPL